MRWGEESTHVIDLGHVFAYVLGVVVDGLALAELTVGRILHTHSISGAASQKSRPSQMRAAKKARKHLSAVF